jgi:hypothetical protein
MVERLLFDFLSFMSDYEFFDLNFRSKISLIILGKYLGYIIDCFERILFEITKV